MIESSKKTKFIQLRTEGVSYDKIASMLNISKSTCSRWNNELKKQISKEKPDKLQDLYNIYETAKKARKKVTPNKVLELQKYMSLVKQLINDEEIEEFAKNKNDYSTLLDFYKTVLASIIDTIENTKAFSTIRQGNATNTLTKLRALEGKTATIDPVTGTATIKKGRFTLTVPNYSSLNGLKTSTYQLLDAITVALTESGAKNPTVVIPLSAYMERRGLKDRKEAKNQVKNDMEILRQASITGEEKVGKNTQAYSFVNIADSGEVKQNGDIVFTFGSTFYQMLLGYPVMPYPDQLQTINNKRNPNSYYLLRKIAEHKNMNIGKKNEDIIAVKTLLTVAAFIPSYEDVMAGNKNTTSRIIDPFERDMDALGETLNWHYCHSNGEPLTDAELNTLNYSLFITLLVKINWKNYPNQTASFEKKTEQLEQAKKKKSGHPPKKRPKKNPQNNTKKESR